MAIFALLNKVACFFFGSDNHDSQKSTTNHSTRYQLKKEPEITISLFSVVEMILADGVKREDAVKAVNDFCPGAFLDGFNGNSLRILSTTMSGSEITCILGKTGCFDYEYWLNDFPEAPRYIIWLFEPLVVGEKTIRQEKCLGLKTDDGEMRLFDSRGKLLAEVPIEAVEKQGKIFPYPTPPVH